MATDMVGSPKGSESSKTRHSWNKQTQDECEHVNQTSVFRLPKARYNM